MAKKESKGASKRKKLPEKFNKLLKVGVYDDTHRKQLQQRAKRVQQLYKQAIDKITKATAPSLFDADPAKEFHFSDFPALNKSVDELIDDMGKQLQLNVEDGDSDAWTLANAKNDMVVNTLASVYSLPKETLKAWRHPHLDALQQFEERRKDGMNLSNGGSAAAPNNVRKGVWNLDQFKNELELALEQGIGQGKSAADLSRDVRQYLKYPNKLFRRVRDKGGVLRLSKAAAAFHPGRGVYRSSYKNALRLTATENNIAYRTCDHLRWNALPFVLGQEIKTSNNHPVTDICDTLAGKYPVEFKFTGWHPFCRCYAVSILANEKELDDYCTKLEQGNDVSAYQFSGKQTKMPEAFTTWMKDNEQRIANAKSMPYFIKDNFKDGDPTKGYRWIGETRDVSNKSIIKAATTETKVAATAKADNQPHHVASTMTVVVKDISSKPANMSTAAWMKTDTNGNPLTAKQIALLNKYDRTKKSLSKYLCAGSTKTLDKVVTEKDFKKIKARLRLERQNLVWIVQADRLALETQIKLKRYGVKLSASSRTAIEEKIKTIQQGVRQKRGWRNAYDAQKELRKILKDPSISSILNPVDASTFEARMKIGETAEQLATRLGKKCPPTLKNLSSKIKKYEKELDDAKEFTIKEKKYFADGMKKVIDNNDFCTNVDSEYLPNIIKEHLKNQFETGSSDGLMNTGVRRNFSEQAFGTSPSTDGKDYEKYGSLISKDLASKGTSYGDTVIRWKKDKVNATFTIGDSLDFDDFVSPSLCTDPNIISVSAHNGKNWMAKNLKKFANTADKTGGELNAAKKCLGDPSYIEIQLHGKVDADCIESVVLPSVPSVNRTVKQEIQMKQAVNTLLDKGIPVYQRVSPTSKKLITITKDYLAKNNI